MKIASISAGSTEEQIIQDLRRDLKFDHETKAEKERRKLAWMSIFVLTAISLAATVIL